MLTTKQIINLARKQEWWNEFDEKRRISIEKAAHCAIISRDYETFITGSFLIDSSYWLTRAEQFAKLCKEEENKNSVPEYDLVVSEKVVARFHPNNQTPSKGLLSKAAEILKESNIAYDYFKYDPEEKVYVAYKNSASWVRR
ncbi:MAG: hypothetical protein MSA89_04200 [Clostridium sp.]|nr:hypothetical protein [Clostridium sp.]